MKDVENNDEEPRGLEKVGDPANEVVADRVGMVDSNRTSVGNSETVVPSATVVPEEVQPTYVRFFGDGDHDAVVGNFDELDHVSSGGSADDLGCRGVGEGNA